MNRAELAEVLRQSELYWGTAGVEGKIADLRYANLEGADLRYANLEGASLCGADLRGANLEGANLRYANLSDAKLRYANLHQTCLGGGAKPIDPAIFGFSAKHIDQTLPLRVAQAILVPGQLSMRNWHTCETIHCIAGWAIHLSGAAGHVLEITTSPSVAGAMLLPSASHLFHSNDQAAIDWAKGVVEANQEQKN